MQINTKLLHAVSTAIDELEKLAFAADTTENYMDFENKLNDIMSNLTVIREGVQENLFKTAAFSKQTAQNQKIIVIIFLIASTFIALAIGLFSTVSISWPLREIVKSARSIAAGDFTQNIRTFGCKEAYEVVEELNTSLNSLRLLIGDINKESQRVAEASAELKTAAKESGRSAAEVSRAMEELARAALNQADQLSQTVQTVNILGEKVRQVSQETLDIASTSEQVANSAQDGRAVTNSVANEINEIYSVTKIIGEVIGELNETTQEIENITNEIREIADQTTLLTLNASIEAARAGEHGKGFSVVAIETGKLAERARNAAQTIADRTFLISEKAKQAVQLMAQGVVRVEEGKNLAGQATVTFEAIFNELKMILAKIDGVAKSAMEMSKHNEEVISAVTTIAAISEESMASTEEVSATAEAQTAAAQEVTASAENLLVISNEMKQTAAVFRI